MSQSAIEAFSVTRQGCDPRADGGTRFVHVSAKRIVIERTVGKVRMRVAVPVASYTGLVISVSLQAAKATLQLCHRDPDLDVALASGDAIDVAQKAKAWGALFGHSIKLEEVGITVLQPFSRQRQRVKPSRRSKFAKRRSVGATARMTISYAGEREIIART